MSSIRASTAYLIPDFLSVTSLFLYHPSLLFSNKPLKMHHKSKTRGKGRGMGVGEVAEEIGDQAGQLEFDPEDPCVERMELTPQDAL